MAVIERRFEYITAFNLVKNAKKSLKSEQQEVADLLDTFDRSLNIQRRPSEPRIVRVCTLEEANSLLKILESRESFALYFSDAPAVSICYENDTVWCRCLFCRHILISRC